MDVKTKRHYNMKKEIYKVFTTPENEQQADRCVFFFPEFTGGSSGVSKINENRKENYV